MKKFCTAKNRSKKEALSLPMSQPRLGILLKILVFFLLLQIADSLNAQVFVQYDPPGNLILEINTPASHNPLISSQPQSQLFYANGASRFSVLVSGPGLSFQWLSNGIPISGAMGDSLVLPNLSTTNGFFSVVISNTFGMVTSTPAALWADSNGNGIPDWWELQYFGNLIQTADGDYDGDGVSNIQEYREGTNPTNTASFNPRLYTQAAHGRVVASPGQPYYINHQIVTLTAIPDSGNSFVGWSGNVSGTKTNLSFVITAHTTVVASFGLPLPTALNNSNLSWTTTGAAPWYGQTTFSEDGIASAQSGLILDGQQSVLTTSVSLSQISQLAFWWSVSCEPPDALIFSVDGIVGASISGTSPVWQQVVTNLPPGNHTLAWTYSKNGGGNVISGIPYTDAGWVDEVALTPTATQPAAPQLGISQPTDGSVWLSWPAPSSGFILQENSALNTTNWVNVTNAVSTVGTNQQVTFPITGFNQFFRLKYSQLKTIDE